MAGTIQINALGVASKPLSVNDIFHLKQGVVDKQCTLADILQPHASRTDNPHGTTKVHVGLGNVNNELQFSVQRLFSEIAGDATKQATARHNLDIISKAEVATEINAHANRKDNPHGVTKAQVQLGNVPNFSPSDDYKENADKLATSRALSALYRAIQAQYPVGSVYLSYSSVNPGTFLLCGGVWELASKGRALVGCASETESAGRQFGANTKPITEANLPAHKHSVSLGGGSHGHVAHLTIDSVTHSHGFHGNTAAYDFPALNTSATDLGTRNTTSNGQHHHVFRDYYYPEHIGTTSKWPHLPTDPRPGGMNMGSGSTDGDNDRLVYLDHNTMDGGAHVHAIGLGSHSHRIDMPAHAHSFSGTTDSNAHTHTGRVTVDATTHSHVGDTATTGGNVAFDVTQASETLYVWKRTR